MIIALVIRALLIAAGLWVARELIDGFDIDGWPSFLGVALILAVLNTYVRPIMAMISLPIMLVTFGLFMLVINTLLLAATAWLAGRIDGIDFSIAGPLEAFLGALIISVVTLVLGWFVKPERMGRGLLR
jgi:putative membrane protein